MAGGDHPFVYALLVYNDELIAGGYFTAAGDEAASSIARWDGAHWKPVGNGMSGVYPTVNALTVYDGELIAGGSFTVAGQQPAVVRWDGVQWRPVGDRKSVVYPTVNALAVYNGELIAGGYLWAADNELADSIVRWDGVQWQPVGKAMTDVHPSVNALTVYRGELIAGGHYPSQVSHFGLYWARWGPPWGDFDGDAEFGLNDLPDVIDCLTGPDGALPQGCECADVSGDGHFDLADFAALQIRFGDER